MIDFALHVNEVRIYFKIYIKCFKINLKTVFLGSLKSSQPFKKISFSTLLNLTTKNKVSETFDIIVFFHFPDLFLSVFLIINIHIQPIGYSKDRRNPKKKKKTHPLTQTQWKHKLYSSDWIWVKKKFYIRVTKGLGLKVEIYEKKYI